jgi:hypothetical protein
MYTMVRARRLIIAITVLEIAVQVNPAGNHPFANLYTNTATKELFSLPLI